MGGKYLKTETGISFIRNALMYLFNHIEYSIDNDRIEGSVETTPGKVNLT